MPPWERKPPALCTPGRGDSLDAGAEPNRMFCSPTAHRSDMQIAMLGRVTGSNGRIAALSAVICSVGDQPGRRVTPLFALLG